MLQVGTLPGSLMAVLVAFRPCFTGPSFRTFCALVAGMIAQPARRTLCGMLVGAGLAGVWHHCRAHRFFGRAVWELNAVSAVLAGLVVDRLVPAGAPVLVAIDDTLFRRSGRRVAAAFWQYDGSVDAPTAAKVGFGNNWLIAGVVVDLPFLSRPTCLPVAFALVTKDGPTKQVLAGHLVTMITTTITTTIHAVTPGRQVDVVADSWYAGAAGAVGAARGGTRGRGFPPRVTLTSRLRANAVLTAIATPTPGKAGRPKRIGARLGTPKQLAAQASFAPATVRRYGRTDPVLLAEQTVLWYGVYRSQAVRVILLREINRAGLLALITTDLTTPAEQIIARYAARWSIEVAIADAKQTTGVGQARNRTTTAVARTVPFGLIVQTLVIIWYADHASHGHHHDTVADRRRQAPWHRNKTEPAYHDMIITLRRTLIAARFRAGKARQPTPEETLAVQLAWAEAAA